MDFIEIKKRYKRDLDYPERCFTIKMYRKVLEGTIYDVIPFPFFKSYQNNLGSDRSPIVLSQRRPSVRYRLSKVVVDNTVSLLFGEGRFPTINCLDEETKNILNKIVTCCHIDLCMIDCATKGSTGSAVILIKLINGCLYFESCYTEYFTPVFNPEKPDELLVLKEKYKINGNELINLGYDKDEISKEKIYWFQRIWDFDSETYYVPVEVSEKEVQFTIDEKRTVFHNLGFVPAVWVKNLPGGTHIDGECTFKDAIDTNIELDYQMSQGGRGLKYSSEPLLMIRNPSSFDSQSEIKPGDILNVDENGDAKHIEISGDACKAVLEYCKALRDIILENIHGNRATPEKNFGAQSGKALEMMHMSLIWLSSRLRISYGEYGLIRVMNIIIKIASQHDLVIDKEIIYKGSLKDCSISLIWPSWFHSTSADRLQDAKTITILKDSNLMSSKTAITTIADEYDIVDIEEEIDEINSEMVIQKEEVVTESENDFVKTKY
jgi:hypothetical protein